MKKITLLLTACTLGATALQAETTTKKPLFSMSNSDTTYASSSTTSAPAMVSESAWDYPMYIEINGGTEVCFSNTAFKIEDKRIRDVLNAHGERFISTPFLGFAVGACIEDQFRVEFATTFSFFRKVTLACVKDIGAVKAELFAIKPIVNAYYDIPLTPETDAYIGFGLGCHISKEKVSIEAEATALGRYLEELKKYTHDKTKIDLAAQLMIGTLWHCTDDISIKGGFNLLFVPSNTEKYGEKDEYLEVEWKKSRIVFELGVQYYF